MKKLIFMTMIVLNTLYAKEGISLEKIFKSTFGNAVSVGQKSIILSVSEMKALQKEAKAKVDSKKIRFYVVKKGKSIEGYGVLVVQRVRTKKAAILYLIDSNKSIKSIEIIAFNEPSEYKPNSTWFKVFEGKKLGDDLKAGHGIPTISGATMSARAISDAARIALAIVQREQ